MLTVSRTFAVDIPVGRVFAYLSDFRSTEDWDPGTVRTTRSCGDGGLGTRYRNTSRFFGREVELEYETTGLEEDRLFEVTGRNDSVTTRDRLSFAPAGEGTEITYEARFDFHGLAGRIPGPLMRLPLDRLADKTVKQLQESLAALGRTD